MKCFFQLLTYGKLEANIPPAFDGHHAFSVAADDIDPKCTTVEQVERVITGMEH